ncbi:MAG: CocE/NonD family hydrolase [Kordiimonadaceae bacterium]|nr:CocE/NonD family hydrolase [Kordiimonadaceae bacterium]MBT6035767.1 CocE/NonD family hydrolase [Kordiimonadaceae bacterium]MBT6329532.1 CocE/NonD family hydrolase [Kordiimonadaceae bacterium]
MFRIIITIYAALITGAFAQGTLDLNTDYSKSVHKITMRDGIKLHTAVYAPKDTSKEYPVLLFRTPYGADQREVGEFASASSISPHMDFVRDGYIFVVQDVRGTYKSEGTFEDIRPPRTDKSDPDLADEITDNYDTIDWAIKNIPANNGRVGQWGVSHPGWFTVMGMIDAHPALKAASPQATTGDPFIGDDGHRNGIFRLMPKLAWAQGLLDSTAPDRGDPAREDFEPDFGTNWGYEFYLNSGPINKINENYFGGRLGSEWKDLMIHTDYDDYYQDRHMPKYMNDITIPVLSVGGWFDAPDPYGTIATYRGIEQRNEKNQSNLIMGPWDHGGWRRSNADHLGDIYFGQNTSEYYNQNMLIPFFKYHLKGEGDWVETEAIMFATGANEWQKFNQWPPAETKAKALYFHDNFKLSFAPPQDSGTDQYINDPKKPSPYSTDITFGYPRGAYRIADQRHQSTRSDVLTYQTDALAEDITIAGPVLAKLITETTGTDADWFVKIIDVFPPDAPANTMRTEMAGYQMLVGAEGMRAKYRNSLSNPEAVSPNEKTPINFEIRDRFHTFKAGHKIMIQIHSTWFPIYDRNPGQFMNIYTADKDDYIKTTQTIHRSMGAASHVVLSVLE